MQKKGVDSDKLNAFRLLLLNHLSTQIANNRNVDFQVELSGVVANLCLCIIVWHDRFQFIWNWDCRAPYIVQSTDLFDTIEEENLLHKFDRQIAPTFFVQDGF